MIKAICFDMFFTLADPHRHLEHTVSDVLNMTVEEWNHYFWEPRLADDRGLGVIRTEEELMERIFSRMPGKVSKAKQKKALQMHKERMRLALCDVRPEILRMLKTLKERGYKVGLISNADIIDKAGWEESPMKPYFDDAIFSCDVGVVKPDRAIYEMSLEHLGVRPEEAVFVGDGGSQEHFGAKNAGMRTVRIEYIIRYRGKELKAIRPYADHVIRRPMDLLVWLDILKRNGEKVLLPEKETGKRYYTYLVRCADDTLYCGYTPSLYKRICAHNNGEGAKYTRARGPVELCLWEVYADKQEAMRREWAIKQMTREEKLRLIRAFEADKGVNT